MTCTCPQNGHDELCPVCTPVSEPQEKTTPQHPLFPHPDAAAGWAFVPQHRVEWFQSKVDALSKRAAKLGVAAPRIEFQPAVVKTHRRRPEGGERPTGWIGCADFQTAPIFSTEQEARASDNRGMALPIRVDYHTLVGVRVIGEEPIKFGGWSLVGRIEHGPKLNVIYSVPGFESSIPERFRTCSSSNCDHCQTTRQRKDTFIVVSEAGEWKQIGSNCIADFLGHKSAATFLSYACSWFSITAGSLMDEDREEYANGPRETPRFSLLRILTTSAWVIRINGFVSRAVAEVKGKTPTSSDVANIECWKISKETQQWIDENPELPEDAERAKRVIGWLETLGNADNEYLRNLHALAANETVTAKSLGLAVSAIAAYTRTLEKQEEKTREAAVISQHVGKEGERADFMVTIVAVKDINTQFGCSHLHIMKDDAGNSLKWFASSESLEEGKRYLLKATVKKHDEYQGKKQTLLTRAKVVEELPLSAA